VESRKPAWYGVRLRVLVLVLLAEISVPVCWLSSVLCARLRKLRSNGPEGFAEEGMSA